MNEWLILIYKVPSEPTRYRASIWRKIKAIGAIYLQSSVCILPLNHKTEKNLRLLRREIEGYGGEAHLVKASFLLQEQSVIDQFNLARNDEYEEVIGRCRDFFKEIENETTSEHFTYGELEENEEDFEKLKKWYKKIKERDFFQADKSGAAFELLKKCEEMMEKFGEQVFECEEIIDDQMEDTSQ
ncbi:MAG: Chromate resistance protein ChrB [Desulfotomaculaceae bacterium]